MQSVKGELGDTQELSNAVAKCDVVVSLLGPSFSDRNVDPTALPNFYKNALFPAMRQHGIKRIFAMGTLSIFRPEDSWTMIRPALVLAVRFLAGKVYRTIIGIGKTFENDATDLDWTVFRLGGIPGESDNESWARDRKDGKAFVGWVGGKGHTYAQKRGALARWLVDSVEGGLPDWIHKMPAVSKLAGS